MPRPVNCCHQVPVWRSYITRSECRSLPVVPKVRRTDAPSGPVTCAAKTMAALHSGQKVTATGVPPTVSLTISCQVRTRSG